MNLNLPPQLRTNANFIITWYVFTGKPKCLTPFLRLALRPFVASITAPPGKFLLLLLLPLLY
jgi:hypothetical protein